MQNIIKAPFYQLDTIKASEGEIAMDSIKSDTYYIYHNGEWHEMAINPKGIELDLYSLNKQIIMQLPFLEGKIVDSKKKLFNELLEKTRNVYYMLYGKEISYFTVFHYESFETENFDDLVVECLENIGNIKSIEYADEEKNAIEIWVESKQTHDVTCLYLFPYDTGVVTFRG